jgi:hypothetical protein
MRFVARPLIVVSISFVMSLIALPAGGRAVPVLPPTAQQRAVADQWLQTYYDSINSPWTGDDAPYAELRQEIDHVGTDSKQLLQLLNGYAAKFTAAPKDPVEFFARNYAAYKLLTLNANVDKLNIQKFMGADFLIIAKHEMAIPHTYNYARLLFLGGTYNWANYKLLPLGARLLDYDPNDVDVALSYAACLGVSRVQGDRDQAQKIASRLRTLYPSDPRIYNLLGIISYWNAFWTHDRTQASYCISNWQRALSLTAPNSYDSQELQLSLARIQELEAQWTSKNGPGYGG